MECKLVVGQHAVCVDDQNFRFEQEDGQRLVKGKVYTISDINAVEFDTVCVQVAEFPWLVIQEGWYRHDRFKPLKPIKVEDFMKEMELT
jgi:hypothetical protein